MAISYNTKRERTYARNLIKSKETFTERCSNDHEMTQNYNDYIQLTRTITVHPPSYPSAQILPHFFGLCIGPSIITFFRATAYRASSKSDVAVPGSYKNVQWEA